MSILDTDNIERTQVKQLALLGFDGPTMASLELFLSKERNLRLVSPEQADLLVVNGDQGIGPDALKAQYAEQYAKPGILISVRDLSWPGFVLLKKPYTSGELLDAIQTQAVVGAGSLDAQIVAEARIAAVMGIEVPEGSTGNDAYDSYRSRVDAGQDAIASITSERNLEEQKRQMLKEKLRRGKDATKRAAEHAAKRAQETVSRKPAAAAVPEQSGVAESEMREALRLAEEARQAARMKADLAVKEAEQRVEATRKRLEQLEEEKRREAARLEAERQAAAKREAEQRKLAEQRAAAKKALAEKKLAEKRALEKQLAEKKALAKKEALKKAKQAEAKLAAEKAARQKALEQAKAKEAAEKARAKALVEKGKLKLLPESEPEAKKKSVAKPAAKTVKKSTAVLSASDEEMVYRCCGNLADVDVAKPDERRRIYFNTDGALLYWLPMAVKKAKMSNTPVEIAGLPRSFVYLPEEDRFFGDFGEDLLLQYALSRFGFGELDLKERLDLAVSKPVATGDKQTLEQRDAMIWKVALWTARGRLNQRMDPEKVYKLKERPEFSRMIEIPHAPEITELWYDHRLSALDIVRILNVPQRFVFAFMSGADALGWLQE